MFSGLLHNLCNTSFESTKKHRLFSLIGMSYYENREDTTWEEIESFCRCLGVTKLIHILKRLCRTPAYRSGLPDCAGRSSKLKNETKKEAQNLKIFQFGRVNPQTASTG